MVKVLSYNLNKILKAFRGKTQLVTYKKMTIKLATINVIRQYLESSEGKLF